MLKDIITHLNIEKQISPDQESLFSAHLRTLAVWQALNFLCFAREYSPALEEHRARQQQIGVLANEYMEEFRRLFELNQLGMSMAGSLELTRILEEKNQLQALAADRHPSLVKEVGLYVIALQLAQKALLQVEEGKVTAFTWEEIAAQLGETPLFSIHPLIQFELERLSREGVNEDLELRWLLWSEVAGVNLPSTLPDLEEAIRPFQHPLDQLIECNPEVKSYLSDLGATGDERYFNTIDILPYLQLDALYAFAQQCVTQEEGEKKLTTLLTMAVRKTGIEVTAEKISRIAFLLLHTPLSEIKGQAQGQHIDLRFLFTQYPIAPEEQSAKEDDSEESLFGTGRLPNFKSEKYTQLLPQLLDWAEGFVIQRAASRNITLSGDKNEYLANSVVDQILNGIKIYEDMFEQVLKPKVTGRDTLKWSIEDIRIMAVIIEFENRRWGGGGMQEAKKLRFIADLKELSGTR